MMLPTPVWRRFINTWSVITACVWLAGCGVLHQDLVARTSLPTAQALTGTPGTIALSASDTTIHPTSTAFREPSPAPVTSTPLSIPNSLRVEPQLADTLPLDQLWVIGSGGLVAVDTQGHLTQLREPITRWLDRPGKPPLLLVSPDEGGPLTVIEPQTWSHISLDFEPNEYADSFAISPDDTQLAVKTFTTGEGIQGVRFYRVDLHTGQLHLVFHYQMPAHPVWNFENISTDPYAHPMQIMGWNGSLLYVYVVMSSTYRFWSLDMSQSPSEPREVESDATTTYWTMQPNGDWLAVTSPSRGAHLVNMRTGKIKQLPANFRLPAFSPDGTLLAAVTTLPHQQEREVTIYDMQRGDTRVLGRVPEREGEVRWSSDGQRLVALTHTSVFTERGQELVHTPRQATLFSRDGTRLGVVQLPDDFPYHQTQVESYLLTNDDQVAVTVHEGDQGQETLRSLPLRSGETPRYPTVWLPGTDLPSWIAIYAPPSP